MKLFIFGPSGSGKTLIGNTLSAKYSIPFFELDSVFWDKVKQEPIVAIKKRHELVDDILYANDWIIEGMYRQDWLDDIIKASDCIFVIQNNRLLRDFYILKRTLRRIFRLEKYERESSFGVLWNFLRFNHLGRFENVHLKEFTKRIAGVKKRVYYVSNISEIEKVIKAFYS